jgi:hypothetical protein
MACSTYSVRFRCNFIFSLAEEKISLRGEKMGASRSKNDLGEKSGLATGDHHLKVDQDGF